MHPPPLALRSVASHPRSHATPPYPYTPSHLSGNLPLKRYVPADPHTVIRRIVPPSVESRNPNNTNNTNTNATTTNNTSAASGSGGAFGGHEYRFLIVATDGLWDVMPADEAVRFVKARLEALTVTHHAHTSTASSSSSGTEGGKGGVARGGRWGRPRRGRRGGRRSDDRAADPVNSFWQEAATALTHEALIRGSLDNIGVCVIDLRGRRDGGAL